MCLAISPAVAGSWLLWIPVLPLVFASVVTITASLYKIFSLGAGRRVLGAAHGVPRRPRRREDQLGHGEDTRRPWTPWSATPSVQGTLSIIFVTLAIIVITAAIISTVRTLRGAETPETEDPRQESRIFAPAGFGLTPAEKELKSRWATEVPDSPKRRAHH